jgi:hypothetical protein
VELIMTTRRRAVTRKSHKPIKITLNRKTVLTVAALIIIPFIMGASCGPDRALWNNPSAPAEDIGGVLDANKKAVKDIGDGAGKGADAVSDWGSELARGWSEADARRKGHKAPESDEGASPVPACDWSEFGPCDQPPPLAWFGITDDNNNGTPDDQE